MKIGGAARRNHPASWSATVEISFDAFSLDIDAKRPSGPEPAQPSGLKPAPLSSRGKRRVFSTLSLLRIRNRKPFGPPLGHWALGTGHWALGTGHWALGTGHWALGTGHWALGTGH